jgi:hypothetical protein
MAGESADAVARRQRAKAERLLRSSQRWEKGAEGERATAAVLDALPSEKWRVLHDVPWPGRPRANLDHVVVGPPGAFIIDSKNWSGSVTVRDGVLRQDRYSRQAVVTSAVEAGRAVSRLLRTTSCPVSSVLCLVRDDDIAATVDGVLVCSTANLVDLLMSRPAVLADVQVQRVAKDIADRRVPVVLPAPDVPAHRGPTGHRVSYLVGAVAAMGIALTLVLSPEAVTGAVEGLASFVEELIGDSAPASLEAAPH